MTGRCPLSVMAVVMLLFAACMTSPQRPQQSPRRRHSGAYSASRWANRKCQVRERAKYLLTFTGLWSQTAFPKQYPKFRPPAQWSGLIAIAHGRKYRMWRLGRLASTGLREMAEQGEAWGLMRELEASIINGRPTISGLFTTPGIANGTGKTFIELEVNSQHPLISFMIKIIPSPDWFVGLDSINLCEGDHWREHISTNLYPYDAGTNSGFTFSSPRFTTRPQEPIAKITSRSPRHPSNSFYYPRLRRLPPIAHVTFSHIRSRQSPSTRQPPIENSIEHPLDTPLDCLVSPWSRWGLCIAPRCGAPGVKRRTRYVRVKPANEGIACPTLKGTAPCPRPLCKP